MAQKDSHHIMYSEFLNEILTFDLAKHIRELQGLWDLYIEIDEDKNGVLNDEEFSQLMKRVGICDSDEDIRYFLDQLDPSGNEENTFSEIVKMFQQVSYLTSKLSRFKYQSKELQRQKVYLESLIKWTQKHIKEVNYYLLMKSRRHIRPKNLLKL